MPHPRPLLGFAVRFVVLYGLLVAPWPGGRAVYGGYFRGLASAVFARETGRRVVRFRPAERPPRPEIDLEIVLADRTKTDAAGNAAGQVLGLDTRGVGWIPTALLVALTLATPVPGRRRWRALGLGLLLVHAYLLGVVAAFLWNQSGGLVPLGALPFWPWLGGFLEETFVGQLGPSFVVPVFLWLAATYRGGESPGWFEAPADRAAARAR